MFILLLSPKLHYFKYKAFKYTKIIFAKQNDAQVRSKYLRICLSLHYKCRAYGFNFLSLGQNIFKKNKIYALLKNIWYDAAGDWTRDPPHSKQTLSVKSYIFMVIFARLNRW